MSMHQLFPPEKPKPSAVKKRPFLTGYANSGFQAWGRRGGGASNWTKAADDGTVPEPFFSYNHYETYKEDFKTMEAGSTNSYRISFEWADFERTQGVWHEETIAFYKDLFAECKKCGMKPTATMLHFTMPLWFSEMGGFEKEENIGYFVTFCKKMFELYGEDLELIYTINEPAIMAFEGYFYGEFPPHEHNLQLCLEVLLNLLRAHVEVSYELINMGCEKDKIGIVHNILRFKPRYEYEPLENLLCQFLTEITNNLVMTFFKTGKFDYENTTTVKTLLRLFPNYCTKMLKASIHYYDPRAVGSLGYIGVNFYSKAVIGVNLDNYFGPTYFPGQKMGDLALTVDPKSFGEALEECASLNVMVVVTECGVADTSDLLRIELLQTYLAVLDEKRANGMNIGGFYFWTFKSNYEWCHGYSKTLFGIFLLDGSKMLSTRIFEDYMKKEKLKHQEEKVDDSRENVIVMQRR